MTLAGSDGEAGIGSYLLATYPQLKIMVLSVEGDTAVLYASGSRQKHVNDVGEATILDAIRELRL